MVKPLENTSGSRRAAAQVRLGEAGAVARHRLTGLEGYLGRLAVCRLV